MRLGLANAERVTLAETAKRLGRKALKDIAQGAKPDTILAWYRRLIAQKFDGSRHRGYPGRPRVCAQPRARTAIFILSLGHSTPMIGKERPFRLIVRVGTLGSPANSRCQNG